jgi:regulatory protein
MQKKPVLTVVEAQQNLEHYCAYQERCHQEVVNKLQELGMIPAAIDAIISSLIQNNYLNEMRFAQSFARGKFRIKKWGKNRILRELKRRNISNYNIKKGMEQISEEDYHTTFLELFEKRKKEVARLPIEHQKKKLISYLSYRGWETELIYDALREL